MTKTELTDENVTLKAENERLKKEMAECKQAIGIALSILGRIENE